MTWLPLGAVEIVLPFALFGAFWAFFASRGRREGMGAREWVDAQNRAQFSRPGWWKPPGVVAALFAVAAVATGTVQAGFRWELLLIPVLVGGVFTAWAFAVTRMARRWNDERPRRSGASRRTGPPTSR